MARFELIDDIPEGLHPEVREALMVFVLDRGGVLQRARGVARVRLIELIASWVYWTGSGGLSLNPELDLAALESIDAVCFLTTEAMGDAKRELALNRPRMAVIGGGHGTGWLKEARRYFSYTLIQGPDDDGFGNLIFPLGVRIPAGDVINTLLQVAELSENDRTFLAELNSFTYWVNEGSIDKSIYDGITDWNEYIAVRSFLWERHALMLEEVSARCGKRLENRGLAALFQGVIDWWQASPLPQLADLHRHDARETLFYGLVLKCSPYADHVAALKGGNGSGLAVDIPAEREAVAEVLADPVYFERAVMLLTRALGIKDGNHHLMVQCAGRALAGVYNDGRPFVGVQNAPRGSSARGVWPDKLALLYEGKNATPANPEALEALQSADLIVRSFGSLSTTTGQILLTPGVREAIRENKNAARIWLANNAPEILEGESVLLNRTLKHAAKTFDLCASEIAAWALVPEHRALDACAWAYIEQRPGESVPVELMKVNDDWLAWHGVAPVRHKGLIPGDTHPEISRPAPVVERLAETYILNRFLNERLGMALHHPPIETQQKKRRPLNAAKLLPPLMPKHRLHQEISSLAAELAETMLTARVGQEGEPVESSGAERFRLARSIRDAFETQRLNPRLLKQALDNLRAAIEQGWWSLRIIPLPPAWKKDYQLHGSDRTRRAEAGMFHDLMLSRKGRKKLIKSLHEIMELAWDLPKFAEIFFLDGFDCWRNFRQMRDPEVVGLVFEEFEWLVENCQGKSADSREVFELALASARFYAASYWEMDVAGLFQRGDGLASCFHHALVTHHGGCCILSEQFLMEDGHPILNVPLLRTAFKLLGGLLVLPFGFEEVDKSEKPPVPAGWKGNPANWTILRACYDENLSAERREWFGEFLSLTGWFALDEWRLHPRRVYPLIEFAMLFSRHLPRGGDFGVFREEVEQELLNRHSKLRGFFIKLLKDGLPD